MRGRLSYISKRYFFEKFFDSKQESKHVISLDTNNLYHYAMSKFLSTTRFKWINPKDFDSNKYSSNS